jgi:phytoene synthase
VVIGAVAALAREAVKFYERSAPLDGYVHLDGRSSLRAMTRIYRELLLVIDRDPAVVLSGRVSLPAWRKAWIALSAVAV